MSKLNIKRSRAAARGVWAYRDGKHWDVIVDSEGSFGLRGLQLTKREAVHLAYRISIASVPKMTVTYG